MISVYDIVISRAGGKSLPRPIFIKHEQWGYVVNTGKGFQVWKGASKFGVFCQITSELVGFKQKFANIDTIIAEIANKN